MKKILLSLAVIGIVSAVVVGGTSAWFSDTEEIKGNTFSTGSIDINVDKGEAQEIGHFEFKDMKPSQTEYMEFTINNTGANSANIWKKINVTTKYDSVNLADKPITEPECVDGNGTWSGGSCSGSYTPKYDLENNIKYDLSVKVYDTSTGTDPIWWQTIYVDGDNKMISDVYDDDTNTTPIYDPAKGVILGMIPAGGKMEVKQSYHLDETVTNWAQQDTMTFDVVVYAEQLQNNVVLVSKSGNDWADIDQDELPAKYAKLTYKVKDQTFKYDFTAQGLTAGTEYVLLAGTNPSNNTDRQVIGEFETNTSGSISALTQEKDLNSFSKAKVWLIPKSDWNGTAMSGWHGDAYLFETALIDFYKI